MKTFTDLEAWKVGMKLVKEVYALTKNLPSDERFGLISQMRRAAVSILANLAEGFGRSGSADKAHKYTISRGECSEVEALLLVSVELEYLRTEDVEKTLTLVHHEGRLLSGLIRAYVPRPSPDPSPINV